MTKNTLLKGSYPSPALKIKVLDAPLVWQIKSMKGDQNIKGTMLSILSYTLYTDVCPSCSRPH